MHSKQAFGQQGQIGPSARLKVKPTEMLIVCMEGEHQLFVFYTSAPICTAGKSTESWKYRLAWVRNDLKVPTPLPQARIPSTRSDHSVTTCFLEFLKQAQSNSPQLSATSCQQQQRIENQDLPNNFRRTVIGGVDLVEQVGINP